MPSAPSNLELRHVSKRYGSQLVVDGLSLEIRAGELVALLGPSGCGKTTTLRMIAGFTSPTAGEVWLGGRNITSLPPYRRDMGMVFQNYALFPHLNVFRNVAFGLEERGWDRRRTAQAVRDALGMVRLENVERRSVRQLSGGQQQRVALARALVINPAVLLLDEPLSNLDAKLRQEMRGEIRRLQRALGIATVFVTHDQEEALSLSDRVVVMNRGRVEQIGAPEEVYEAPATPFVARFMGNTNLLDVQVAGTEGAWTVARTRDGLTLRCRAHRAGARTGQPAHVALRPERVMLLSAGPTAAADNQFSARIEFKSYVGHSTLYTVRLGPQTAIQVQSSQKHFQPGDAVEVQFGASDALLIPPAGSGFEAPAGELAQEHEEASA